MKKIRGFTLIQLVVVVFFACFGFAWAINAIKLLNCDFDANYKCEVTHVIGLVVPPISVFTVWFDDDNK